MKKTTHVEEQVRKNIFDLARELALLVDEIDLKKVTKKTNL